MPRAEPGGAGAGDRAALAEGVVRLAGDDGAAAEVERVRRDRPGPRKRLDHQIARLPDRVRAELLDGAGVDDPVGGALHVAAQARAVDQAPTALRTERRLFDAVVLASGHQGQQLVEEDEEDLAHLQGDLPPIHLQDVAAALLHDRSREGGDLHPDCGQHLPLALRGLAGAVRIAGDDVDARALGRLGGIAGNVSVAQRQPVEHQASPHLLALEVGGVAVAREPHRSLAAQMGEDGEEVVGEVDGLLGPLRQVLLQQPGDEGVEDLLQPPRQAGNGQLAEQRLIHQPDRLQDLAHADGQRLAEVEVMAGHPVAAQVRNVAVPDAGLPAHPVHGIAALPAAAGGRGGIALGHGLVLGAPIRIDGAELSLHPHLERDRGIAARALSHHLPGALRGLRGDQVHPRLAAHPGRGGGDAAGGRAPARAGDRG